MGKAGRKRKAKPVSVAGGPTMMETLNRMAREKSDKIMAVAMNNPLRRPFAGQKLEHPEWLESALGRLCTVQRLKVEIYDAATNYATLVRSYRAAIAAPVDLQIGEGLAVGLGPSRETIERWASEISGCKKAIIAAVMREGFAIFERLAIDDLDLPPTHVLVAQKALMALAIHMGKTSARISAFA